MVPAATSCCSPLRDEIGSQYRDAVATSWTLVAVVCLGLVPLAPSVSVLRVALVGLAWGLLLAPPALRRPSAA